MSRSASPTSTPQPLVLGVDPGLSRCGVAVLAGPSFGASLVTSDVVRTPADMPLGRRLHTIAQTLDALVAKHKPSALAVERIFINAQASTGVGAIQVVGLVHLCGERHGLPVAEYTPSQVKAAVTGEGNATKEQVIYMMQRILQLSEAPKPADRADAMAVAMCHLNQPNWTQDSSSQTPLQAAMLAHQRGSGGAANTGGMAPRLAAALAQQGPGLAGIPPQPKRLPAGQGPSNTPASGRSVS